jgi:hypothetical protein
MEQLDPEIFKQDREGITLKCGYLSKMEDWTSVDELLAKANTGLIAQDAYLANWRAISNMMNSGAETSAPLFEQLRQILDRTGSGFWDDANLVNALLALDELDAAKQKLRELEFKTRPKNDVDSAARFYDEIIRCFRREFDWKSAAGL